MNFNRTSFQTRVGASKVVARLPAGCCLGHSQSAWVRLWGDLSSRDPRGSWPRGGPHPHQAPAHELWGGAFLSPGRHAPVHSYPGCPRPWGQLSQNCQVSQGRPLEPTHPSSSSLLWPRLWPHSVLPSHVAAWRPAPLQDSAAAPSMKPPWGPPWCCTDP